MEYITIESHFGLLDPKSHSIRAYTRNKYSDSIVTMFGEISQILCPEEDFEIYFLPPKHGSYKDIIRIVRKNPIKTIVGTATLTATVTGVLFTYLTYRDTHETHEHEKSMWSVDDMSKCLSLMESKVNLEKEYDLSGFPEEKINKICGNLLLRKRKNDIYQTLKDDETITNEEIILKGQDGSVLQSEKIEHNDFEKYIVSIPAETAMIDNVNGIIELDAIVIRQRKEGKGVQWRGVYYGNTVTNNGRVLLSDGEAIGFYMQDNDFKENINQQKMTFASGDNMYAFLEIKSSWKENIFQKKDIYVKKVEKFNEAVIEHKEKVSKTTKNNLTLKNQISLF